MLAGSSHGTASPNTRVGLVIPVYRGWDHVETLLTGLEPFPAWLAVHVVDDASGDHGGVGLLKAHPQIDLITRDRNAGFAAAVNSGVARAAGAEVLVVANSDLQLSQATIRQLVHVAAPGLLIVAPETARVGRGRVAVGHPFPTVLTDAEELFLVTRAIRRVRRRRSSLPADGKLVRVDWVIGSCFAFSRSLWDRVGPLDESFHMYSEEIDWQRRANALGFASCWLPGVEVLHDEMHGAADNAASPERTRRFVMIWRSRLLYHQKNGSRIAGIALRGFWGLSFVANAPILLPLSVLPWPGRQRAKAELLRARILLRAAVSGTI